MAEKVSLPKGEAVLSKTGQPAEVKEIDYNGPAITSLPMPVQVTPNTLLPWERPFAVTLRFATPAIEMDTGGKPIPLENVQYAYAEIDFEPSAEIFAVFTPPGAPLRVFAVTPYGEVIAINPSPLGLVPVEALPPAPPSAPTIKAVKLYVIIPQNIPGTAEMMIVGTEKNLGTAETGELEFEPVNPVAEKTEPPAEE